MTPFRSIILYKQGFYGLLGGKEKRLKAHPTYRGVVFMKLNTILGAFRQYMGAQNGKAAHYFMRMVESYLFGGEGDGSEASG